jgi:hypothetical protein
MKDLVHVHVTELMGKSAYTIILLVRTHMCVRAYASPAERSVNATLVQGSQQGKISSTILSARSLKGHLKHPKTGTP